uniref:Nuclear factor, erythroid 2-like 3 n=1 Tax=Neogobius melanostomus TaxID=47308 RepID=A0A8C6T5I4_9GOBI
MQFAKKYLTEGLIQLTILLSLIGVRVDIDGYLNEYYTPLIEINLGPSSAYTQTPFHSLRDTLDGYTVHPKCPELDYFFASRRLLDEVRSLGSPRRFPTPQLNAWLVHQVSSATDKAECGQLSHSSDDTELQSTQDEEGSDAREHLPPPPPDSGGHEGTVMKSMNRYKCIDIVSRCRYRDLNGYCHPLMHCGQMLTPVTDLYPLCRTWTLWSTRVSQSWTQTSWRTLSCLTPQPPSTALVPLPRPGGGLDEAVFEHINQLGLGLDSMDHQLLNCLDPQLLEDFDSDSGLSLESSSSDLSSSSSLCEDECGATGYSSEADSKSLLDHGPWSPVDLSEGVWHDHSYASPPLTYPHKGIKEEPMSDDEGSRLDDRELSRDELRARAMCLPFSVLQIVNMPVEEFLDVLESHGFTPDQVTLLRDIRRRGKNKLAAQNCRKRKLDAITGLQEEVARLQAQRDRLLRDKRLTAKTMCAVGQQIQQLTRDVLSRLRDPLGQPLNPDRYSLQCGANGKVVLVPARRPTVSGPGPNKTDKRKKGKKQ